MNRTETFLEDDYTVRSDQTYGFDEIESVVLEEENKSVIMTNAGTV